VSIHASLPFMCIESTVSASPMGANTSKSAEAEESASDEKEPAVRMKMRRSPWPVLNEITMIVYVLVLMVYFAWPVALIGTSISKYPLLAFFMFFSIVKVVVPLFGIFIAIMHMVFPSLLGLYIAVVFTALFDSVILLFIILYHTVRANILATPLSFGNDLLYCCKFAGQLSECPASYAPCAGFSGILTINQDIIVLFVFHCIFIVLEVLAIVFMIQLYNQHVSKGGRLSWKSVMGGRKRQDMANVFQSQVPLQTTLMNTITGAPRLAVQTIPIWLQQIDKSLSKMVYGPQQTKKKLSHTKTD